VDRPTAPVRVVRACSSFVFKANLFNYTVDGVGDENARRRLLEVDLVMSLESPFPGPPARAASVITASLVATAAMSMRGAGPPLQALGLLHWMNYLARDCELPEHLTPHMGCEVRVDR